MRHENSGILELNGKEVSEFTPSKPREKWLRKRTHVKIRVSAFSLPCAQKSHVAFAPFNFLNLSSERDGQPPRE